MSERCRKIVGREMEVKMERSKAFESKLIPYADIIKQLRKEGVSYAKLALRLETEYGIHVHRDTIHSFVKVRSKQKHFYKMKEKKVEVSPSRMKKTKSNKADESFDFSKFVNAGKIQNQDSRSKFDYDETKPIK